LSLCASRFVTKRHIYTYPCDACVTSLALVILHVDSARSAHFNPFYAVPTAYLLELLEPLPARCQAIVDANGMILDTRGRLVQIERFVALYLGAYMALLAQGDITYASYRTTQNARKLHGGCADRIWPIRARVRRGTPPQGHC
jgi:hypothetical protein